ncbi:hypothetical protein Chor_009384 [Crotalus horridus]
MIQLSRRARSMLSLGLNCLALCFSVSAFSTSYWCEGTHKVVKSPCLSVVKKGNCAPNNSNGTVDTNETVDPHKVQYIWETGEDKYAFQYFHTGFWLSCEEHHGGIKEAQIDLPLVSGRNRKIPFSWRRGRDVGMKSLPCSAAAVAKLSLSFLTVPLTAEEKCRSFIELPPESEKGLLGMVAHMMYMTVFQVAVNLGPKDWRPQTWYYGWSFGSEWKKREDLIEVEKRGKEEIQSLAWLSFTLCMSASVLTLNTYTKTILEFKYRRQIFEKYTASTGSIRGSNSSALSPDLEHFLWEKYIFSVSESLDFSASPPSRLALSGGRKECSGGYAGLPRSHSGDTKDGDDGEPC